MNLSLLLIVLIFNRFAWFDWLSWCNFPSQHSTDARAESRHRMFELHRCKKDTNTIHLGLRYVLVYYKCNNAFILFWNINGCIPQDFYSLGLNLFPYFVRLHISCTNIRFVNSIYFMVFNLCDIALKRKVTKDNGLRYIVC